MAFTDKLVYVRFNFVWLNSTEIQATGFFARKTEAGAWPAPGEIHYAQSIAEMARDAFKSHIRTTHYANNLQATSCLAYTMKDDGIHVSEKGMAGFDGSNEWLPSGGTSMPPETTVVLSTWSRDPSQFQGSSPGRLRGRMYLPTPNVAALGSDGYIGGGTVTDWLSDWNDFFGAFADPLEDVHLLPVVRSLGGKDGESAENVSDIRFLRMGRVVDAQRRRRNALTENYVTEPIDYP